MRRLAILAALAAVPFSAASMTMHDAGGNLFVFEFMRQSADYCEGQGFPVRAQQEAWMKEHGHVQGKSVDAIRAESEKQGLTQAEVGKILSDSDAFIRQKAESLIKERGIPCEQYQAILDKFSPYLKE